MDVRAFRHFAPLLAASQAYARRSGCRFRGGDFPGAGLKNGGAGEDGNSPSSGAWAAVEPVAAAFAARLRAGEAGLLEEVERAHRRAMVESVRNAMAAAVIQHELWPPAHPPPQVKHDDCTYEDVSAPFEVIAQRLYNDEARRLHSAVALNHRPCACPQRFQAMTACFLVDFASEVGAALPGISETLTMMLQDFAARATEYEQREALRLALAAASSVSKAYRSCGISTRGGGGTLRSCAAPASRRAARF